MTDRREFLGLARALFSGINWYNCQVLTQVNQVHTSDGTTMEGVPVSRMHLSTAEACVCAAWDDVGR